MFCSWSGGKDSALAMHRAKAAGAEPRRLITMMIESGERSRSHGLSKELLEAQAAALGLPIHFEATTWDGYDDAFQRAVRKAAGDGLGTGIFGDIDIAHHRQWVETMCAQAGASAILPLWQSARPALMRELLDAGFRAVLVAVRDGKLPPELLGEVIDDEMLGAFERHGVDLAGENGEYHTVVVDGPVFRTPLEITPGDRSLRDGVWFIDLAASAP